MSGDVRLENENGAVEIHVSKLGNVQVTTGTATFSFTFPTRLRSSWMPAHAAAKSNQTLTL